ncbi:uncharacterized protein LOC108666368 isoform X2 [Hyalella azteca]|uniref:Uncharacterized protein LOC108666368 isoform X2 n=1 Tax=Hyalella azteca TaxID=294128 RepID=A0A8B7N4C1_HYAAZ|nr:uncharacterized protein LOC108666368 isoform X2 [Hyalella azteca]
MRRPTLCCDNQSTADVDSPCKDQGGTFARMRRLFLSKPLSRRSLSGSHSSTKPQHRDPGASFLTRSELTRGSCSSRPALPLLQLDNSFLFIEQQVLGADLEVVIRGPKSEQGVPQLVYQLCSYILNHDVDSSALVYEEWCSSDVKDVLSRHPRCSSLEACNVAPLLRLFVERLPAPLLPHSTAVALVGMADDSAPTEARRLLLTQVSPGSLSLLRYLTAFASCLSHSNRCGGGETWVLLAAGAVGSRSEDRALGRPVAEYLLRHSLALFPDEPRALPPAIVSDSFPDSSDASLTALTSQEEDNDEDEEKEERRPGLGVVTHDEDYDRMSSSSSSPSSSRSCTTTSEDTEGFRCPQLGSGQTPGTYLAIEEAVSPDFDDYQPGDKNRVIIYHKLLDENIVAHESSELQVDTADALTTEEIDVRLDESSQEDLNDGQVTVRCATSDSSPRSHGVEPDISSLRSFRETQTSSPAKKCKTRATARLDTEVVVIEPTWHQPVAADSSCYNLDDSGSTTLEPVPPESSCRLVSRDDSSGNGSVGAPPAPASASLTTATVVTASSVAAVHHGSRQGKRKEHVDEGLCEEHEAKVIRSTGSSDHALLSLPFSCDAPPVATNWDKLIPSPADESASEAGVEESDSSVLNQPCGQWNDFASVGEVYLGDSQDAPVQDSGEPWITDADVARTRRWSERFYPVRSSATEYQSPERRHPHKSKKRKSKSRRHSKESSAAIASCEGSEEEKLSSSRPQSGDDDENDGRSSPATDTDGPPRPDSLSSLLDHSEPAVTSDRGRWQSPPLDDHRTALLYSRYSDDETNLTTSSGRSWHKYDHPLAKDPLPTTTNSSFSSAFIQAVAGKYSGGGPSHRNISAIKKRIKRFEEDFEHKFGYKPSHSEKMKHKEIKKYMSDLNKARKELKTMKEGVADLVSSSKGFSLSLLRCQESTSLGHSTLPDVVDATPDHAATLIKVEERLRDGRQSDDRPSELSKMTLAQMQDEKTCLQKALLYYESIHGRPNTRDTRELARPLYDRYRQVKRSVSRAQLRAKENVNELAPIFEHVAMDFTLASPQHRSSLTPDSLPTEQLLLCKEKLLQEQRRQSESLRSPDSDDEGQQDCGQEASLSDSSDVSKQSSTLGNLHSLPLHELKERRREAKDQKKKLRKSLRQFEERYEREHGHKLAKENRGSMEQNYLDYKHAKAKLRLLEALIAKKAPTDDEF